MASHHPLLHHSEDENRGEGGGEEGEKKRTRMKSEETEVLTVNSFDFLCVTLLFSSITALLTNLLSFHPLLNL